MNKHAPTYIHDLPDFYGRKISVAYELVSKKTLIQNWKYLYDVLILQNVICITQLYTNIPSKFGTGVHVIHMMITFF